jgi:hypothetical protein
LAQESCRAELAVRVERPAGSRLERFSDSSSAYNTGGDAMVKKCGRAGALAGLLAISMACTGTTYTMANVELDPNRYETLGQSEIKTTGLMLFGLIPIQNNDKIQRAADHIIKKMGGDELVDIRVTESWFWAYILNGYQIEMKGTVVKKK